MKRPSTFKDWRRVRNNSLFRLGEYVAFLVNESIDSDGRRVPMTRELWRKLSEIRRIEARMKVEFEVKDGSYYEALFDMIFRKDEK